MCVCVCVCVRVCVCVYTSPFLTNIMHQSWEQRKISCICIVEDQYPVFLLMKK